MSCLTIVLLGVGCSGSEEPAAVEPVLSVFDASVIDEEGIEVAASVDREFGAEPEVEQIHFEPGEPESRGRIEAVARVSGDWTSLRYVWMKNGERFGPNAADVALPRLSTGDVISVRVTPYQNDRPGRALLMESRVHNQRPRVSTLSIERVEAPTSFSGSDEASGGETWRAAVRAEDPDGDAVDIEYRWLVNGEPSQIESAFFPASRLVKGDRIALRARAFDGRTWSRPAESGEIVIGNSLPVIISVPPRPRSNGFFSYAVRATDSSGVDGLRYSLRRSPRGMKIDASSGVVTWTPDPDQSGRHEVEIVVRDQDGGEASQSFSLALVEQSEAGRGPASPH